MVTRMITFIALLALAFPAFAELPARPKSTDHPGSDAYDFGVETDSFRANGRDVSVYLPTSAFIKKGSVPVVVFGAGQASPEDAYRETFMHLAGKGVAVIFPEYSRGFFDQNWRRMGADYANLAAEAVRRFPTLDSTAVVFSGHSKGAYVAGVAAGLEEGLRPQSIVLFQPAGYDRSAWSNVDQNTPVTVIYSDADTIIEENLVREIYDRSEVVNKQYLYVRSYPTLSADHFFIFSKDTFIGGRDGISPFHYYGAFGWLIGAAKDIKSSSPLSNEYIYGNEATNSGSPDIRHEVERSW